MCQAAELGAVISNIVFVKEISVLGLPKIGPTRYTFFHSALKKLS